MVSSHPYSYKAKSHCIYKFLLFSSANPFFYKITNKNRPQYTMNANFYMVKVF